MGQWTYKFITATFDKSGNGIDVVTHVDGLKVQHRFSINEALNELGKDEWELVEALSRKSDDSQETDLSVYILKRFINQDYMGETSSVLAVLRNPFPPPRRVPSP